VSDHLDHLLAPADALLHRVDELLAEAGAPAGHPVWTALRRVRLLPGDAVRAVAALRPAALADAEPALRARSREFAEAAAALPDPGGWTGEAADSYDARRNALAARLGDDPGGLAERLSATADHAAMLTGWMTRRRRELAGVLADALGSAEAVALLPGADATGPPSPVEAQAAAQIAAWVLHTVADTYDEAAELLAGSATLVFADRSH
jgi:hypothetical protein